VEDGKGCGKTLPELGQNFPRNLPSQFSSFGKTSALYLEHCAGQRKIANKIEIKAKIVSLVQFIAKPRLEQRQVSATAEVNRTLNGRNGFHHQLCWEKSSTYRFSYKNPSILHSLTMLGEGSTKERL
jgi:hypothetical protein